MSPLLVPHIHVVVQQAHEDVDAARQSDKHSLPNVSDGVGMPKLDAQQYSKLIPFAYARRKRWQSVNEQAGPQRPAATHRGRHCRTHTKTLLHSATDNCSQRQNGKPAAQAFSERIFLETALTQTLLQTAEKVTGLGSECDLFLRKLYFA